MTLSFFVSSILYPVIAERVLIDLGHNTEENIRGVSFTCNIRGLPMTSATWDSTCASIVDQNTVEQVDMLQDPLTSSYMTELMIQNVNLSSFKDCTLTCDVYSKWALASQSNLGRQRMWKSTKFTSEILL